ncbi:MAG: CDP-diacylglycerol--glycerol-3-phosphate 3-phosphatidyltransferase [Pirellulaceae bacterium]
MTEQSAKSKSGGMNLPNQITVARLIVSVIMFITIPLGWYWVSLILFVLAAGTDWLDGYIARKYNLVTQLGRILDPFADKLLICGVFIFLAAEANSSIAAWMAVIVVARELLITAIRSFLETHGADFSASMAGS